MPGRNNPCHCGSGKKYKKCCQDQDQKLEAAKLQVKEKPIRKPEIEKETDFSKPWTEDENKDFDTPRRNDSTHLLDSPYPEISEEEEALVDAWWAEYEEIEDDAEEVLHHIQTFLETNRPEVSENLGLEEEVIFELGGDLLKMDKYELYIDFLKNLRVKFPVIYEKSAAYFDQNIITWLVITDDLEQIPDYLDYLMKQSGQSPEKIFEIHNLLLALNLEDTLLLFINSLKKPLLEEKGIFSKEDILTPLVYHQAEKYLKPEITDGEIHGLIDSYKDIFPFELEVELEFENWKERIPDFYREMKPWEIPVKAKKNDIMALYQRITDHYMFFMHHKFGLSLTSARYYSELLFRLLVTYREVKKGKMKNLFEFDIKVLDEAILILSRIELWFIDATQFMTYLNAYYYFAEYLFHCQVLDEMEKGDIQDSIRGFLDSLPEDFLNKQYIEMKCFQKFPLWD